MGFQQLPTASNTFHAPMCSDFLSEASGATSSAGACNEAAMHRDRGDCVPSRWTCHEFATIRYSWIILGSGAWYKWITLNYNEYSLSTCNWHQLAISIKVLHALSCLSNCMEHTRWFLLPPCRTSGVASTKKRLGLKWSVCPHQNMSKHVETCPNCLLSWLLTPAPSALETKVWDAKARCVIPPARFNHRNSLKNVTKMPRSANVLTNLANGQTGILPLAGRRTNPSGLHRYYHCTCIYI